MGKRQITLKKEVLLFVVSIFSLTAIILFFIGKSAFTSTLKASKLQELKRLTNVIKNYIDFNNFDISKLDAYESLHAVRISLFNDNADVLYESDKTILKNENHKDRKEIREAIKENSGTDIRKSSSLNEIYLYYAEKYTQSIDNYENEFLIIRLACPLSEIKMWTKEFLKIYIPSLLFLLIIFLLITLLILKMLSSPLKKLEEGANEYKNGNFDKEIDISTPEEMHTLASALNDMAISIKEKTEKTQRLERIRKDFVSNVSHELKTPITSIKGFSELLLEKNIDEMQKEKFISIIHKNANQMENIIQDLLLLASLENDEFTLETEETNIEEFLNESLSKVEYKRNEKNDTIKLNIDRNVGTFVKINKNLLTIAITNLLINAMNYSAPCSLITLSMMLHKNILTIRIKDQGIGIPLKEQDKIFERFYRVDKSHSRENGGTGLGLSIVKHISSVHGGNVTVKSEGENKGSTFTLSIKTGD